MVNRERAEQTFLEYASHYNMEDPKIRLKVGHTLRVAGLCERIAGSLDLDPEEKDLAWMIGLLHDIGRFEQVRIYHTFRDAESVNHAQFSADLLFRDGKIRDYISVGMPPASTGSGQQTSLSDRYRIMETAIRYHNAYRLPESLTEQERTYSQILRDADKIDILRVNRETPMTQIYNLPEEAFLTSGISDPVYEDMLAHRDVNRANSRTGVDFLMGHIAFVFGLVYPISFRIVEEQGYLEQMLAFESRNERTRERMNRIRKEVRDYIRKKREVS